MLGDDKNGDNQSLDSFSSDAFTDKKSVVEEFLVIEYDNLADQNYIKMVVLLTI